MKKTFLSLSALTIAVALTTSFTACSNEDLTVETAIEQPKSQTFTLSVPATLDNGTRAVSFNDGSTKSGTKPSSDATFEEGEEVYVYNVTKGVVLNGSLTAENISEDGKSCDLTGTFRGEIEKGDELKLFYNMDLPYFEEGEDPLGSHFGYGTQNGTADGVLDGGEATVTVSEDENGQKTTSIASFQLLQSMFRFQFKEKRGITINSLIIKSKNNALVKSYYPLEDESNQNYNSNYNITFSGSSSKYYYVAMRIDESKSAGDMLKFIGFSQDSIEYKGTKSAPKDGFKNGKYYYSTSAIQMTKYPLVEPDIDWINVREEKQLSSEFRHCYDLFSTGTNQPAEIAISGTSNNWRFYAANDAIFHLNNLTALYDYSGLFIRGIENLTLDIKGANSISCEDENFPAILAVSFLYLSGDGTLTVTSSNATCCGIRGGYNYTPKNANNNYETTTELDVTDQLAASGYTVTRSARQDNADGTYTWTYTVKPKE